MFPKNMGVLDRALRFVIGAVLVPVGLVPLGGAAAAPAGVVVAALGTVMLVTALTGRCPSYVPFGIDTRGGALCCGRPRTAS